MIQEANGLIESLLNAFSGKKNKVFSDLTLSGKETNQENLNSIINRAFDKADKDTFGASVINMIRNGSLDSGTINVVKNIISTRYVCKHI